MCRNKYTYLANTQLSYHDFVHIKISFALPIVNCSALKLEVHFSQNIRICAKRRMTRLKEFMACPKYVSPRPFSNLQKTERVNHQSLEGREEEKLNAFHRQQLRKMLNIKYPVKITNSSLYEKCNECPLSITLLENRWRLFGHIHRRNSEIPANKSMKSYFISHGSKFKGRPLTTLPVVLNKDLTRVSDDKLQLTSLKDLEHLRSVSNSCPEQTGLEKTNDENPRSCRRVTVG